MRGHVRKRGTKWCFVLDVGRDEAGKRSQKWFSGFRTKKEAEQAMAAKMQEVNTGNFTESSHETFGAYIQRWLDDKQSQVRPSTYRSYEWLVRCHIVPNIGHIRITDLRPQHLQTMYRKLSEGERPLSNRSIQQLHTVVHESLKRAMKWGIVHRNISDAVDPPRIDRKRSDVWTPEQSLQFIEGSKGEERYWIGFVLAIMTGMRKGEILGLRWSDIDMERGYAQVRQTLGWVAGKPVLQEPKTERSRRSVALSPETILALEQHRNEQVQDRLFFDSEYKDHGLIIARPDGSPQNPRTFDDAWYRALERSELPRIRFHDLRHTHASILLQQGVHPKIVSERLGHATISITLDTYSHVLPGLQKEIADRFDDIIFKPKK